MLLKRVLSYFRLFEKGRSQSIDKYNRVDISLFKFTSNRERTLKKTHPFSLSPVDDLKILEYNRHILRKRIAQSISFLCEKGRMGFLPRFQCIVLTSRKHSAKVILWKGRIVTAVVLITQKGVPAQSVRILKSLTCGSRSCCISYA